MKNTHQLINNIIGQLNGIDKMIKKDEDCLKITVQLKAVRAATSSLMIKIAEQDFSHCVRKSTSKEKIRLEKIFKEIIKK